MKKKTISHPLIEISEKSGIIREIVFFDNLNVLMIKINLRIIDAIIINIIDIIISMIIKITLLKFDYRIFAPT